MPACAIRDCHNSSRKKVKMNCFPTDPDRRKAWVSKCAELGNMTNWTPNKYSALCSYHFTADMWETPRVDGTIKLKRNAVPTIFGDHVHQVKNKADQDPLATEVELLNQPTENREIQLTPIYTPPIRTVIIVKRPQVRKKSSTETSDELTCLQESEASIEKCRRNETQLQTGITTDQGNSNITEATREEENIIEQEMEAYSDIASNSKTSHDDISQQEKTLLKLQKEFAAIDPNSVLREKYEKLEKLYYKSELLRMGMKKRHHRIFRSLRGTIKKLQDKVRNTEARVSNPMKNILNQDQLNILNKVPKKMPQWCDETLVKAYQIKSACGVSGYKKLLNQNIDLPPLRTLRRRFEKKPI